MTIKVRLSGEPAEIAQLVEHLRDHFDVAGSDRSYPTRGSFGVRVYIEVRPRTEPPAQQVRGERVLPDRKGIES